MTKSFENDSDTNHGLNSHRKPEDASFMREAVRLSQLAVEHGNEPFGAVLVKNGEIVFTNENQIYTRHDPTLLYVQWRNGLGEIRPISIRCKQ